ncbi:MAG: CarD family transcriptional regulator [Clostridiales bacterium]|jgi:CarD family transcriptional regulator|nr:CarD family transcriptional regulator [Clostridiales bacterium]
MIFNKGDNVFHPVYGAGTIENIESKIIEGCEKSYYTLYVPIGNLKVQVSADNPKNKNMRKIFDHDDILKIFSKAEFDPFNSSESWVQYYEKNQTKLKSGDISQVSSVYKYLYDKEKNKTLSTTEKKMMHTAKQMLVGEISLSSGIKIEEAENLLKSKLININDK